MSHKLHAQSQLQCGTMKTSEFMITQVELAEPTLSEMYTLPVQPSFTCAPRPLYTTRAHTFLQKHQPRARYNYNVVDESIKFVGSINSTCVVMNSDVFIVPHCSCDCACNLKWHFHILLLAYSTVCSSQ